MLSLASFIIMRRHVTANEVYEFIKEAYPTIGKGTVYRNLDILVEEGALRKVEVPDGSNRFDFTLKNHYHVRCIKCGEVFDVDMEQIPDLLERIHNSGRRADYRGQNRGSGNSPRSGPQSPRPDQIGRASCRERV